MVSGWTAGGADQLRHGRGRVAGQPQGGDHLGPHRGADRARGQGRHGDQHRDQPGEGLRRQRQRPVVPVDRHHAPQHTQDQRALVARDHDADPSRGPATRVQGPPIRDVVLFGHRRASWTPIAACDSPAADESRDRLTADTTPGYGVVPGTPLCSVRRPQVQDVDVRRNRRSPGVGTESSRSGDVRRRRAARTVWHDYATGRHGLLSGPTRSSPGTRRPTATPSEQDGARPCRPGASRAA